ncbi:hypothetical protein [Archangium lipolyticum]|uniref:hypothetical protein n=1 Tax=Archangium lipolyticum TaxID=2970465 RepID=UPI00214A0204|nr:hypothetical protein [Archangium lipolyticum]
MKTLMGTLCLATLLTVTSARAQETQTPVAETQSVTESGPNRLQGVGDVDIRATLNADIILAFVNLGVGADLGLLKLGPGVLAVGGELEVGACVTPCLALNLATGYSFSHLFYSPHARATYHFVPEKASGLEKVDLYGLVLAGITYTTTSVTGDGAGTPFEYKGHDVSPSVGLGVGGKYFLQDNLFLGAEGRLRLSSGQYNYTVRAGNVTLSDSQSTWSMSGFNVQLFAGLRL